MRLGFEEPFLHRLLPVLGQVMGSVYGELIEAEEASRGTVRSEEEKFLATIATASRQVQEAVDRVRAEGGDRLPGAAVFRLYDTYGLPLEMIREIAEEQDHHPAILVEYGKVTLTWWTHKIKGLHRNDFICAARCDRLFEE